MDALAKIMDLFQDAGLSKNTVNFVLGIIWELLPENAREKIVATTEAGGEEQRDRFLHAEVAGVIGVSP